LVNHSIVETATNIASLANGARDAEKKDQSEGESEDRQKNQAEKAANVGLAFDGSLKLYLLKLIIRVPKRTRQKAHGLRLIGATVVWWM
jgi:hypothetical protein